MTSDASADLPVFSLRSADTTAEAPAVDRTGWPH